ncbi:hypothetical protein N7492_002374 [Penicillium capsulatum]|uniref:Uncharacterized protein n=1 Tax=Penicillium capsulatum TaxID=69766 RepID=A0A9W9IJX0_9EURO|nr:hypothetical protein N7492_002374 [Penicillium capsulatum]
MSNNASDKSRAARPKAKNPSGLTSHLGNLAAKSKLDEFRRFFDLKLDVWREFRDRLHRIVYDSFSWPQVQVLDNRHACAEEFLKQWGLEYWGTPENRDKYLMEEHLGSEDFCIYPDHKAV